MIETAARLNITDYLLARVPRYARNVSPMVLRHMGRKHLPTFVRDIGMTRGAEIGVWKGEFSAKFCEANPVMHMLCVDPWLSYPAWLDTKNAMPEAQATAFIAESHQIAQARLAPLNCTIIRKFSIDAAKDVPDQSLDFVFIDGNHVYDAVLDDLEAWTPKVKPGGFISGHDYRAFPNKPTIHVIQAVQTYTKQHAIHPWFVLAAEKTPSFIWEVR